jgi:hypothetical protein
MCRPATVNHNDDREGEKDTQGGEKRTGRWPGTRDGMRNGMWKGKGNGEGKGIVDQTPGGDDISHAVNMQLQKEIPEADLDMAV